MAEIAQRIFVYTPKNFLRLGGEQWTRSLGVLSGWSRLRIGILCAPTPNGVNSYSSNFNFGVCNGQQNAGGSATCQSAVGACMTGSMLSSATGVWPLTYNANSGSPYYTTNGKMFRRYPPVGGLPGVTIESATAIGATAITLAGTGNSKRRCPIIMDIQRRIGGGGQATISLYTTAAGNITIDYRPDHLLDAIDQLGVPVINGQTLNTNFNTTFGMSDMLGGLDTMFIEWSKATYPLEIYAIGASVVRENAWGTTSGGSFDPWDYATGTATPAIITGGSGFSAPIVFGGTYSNPSATVGYAGTSAGFAFDPFESYAVGTITSNVTLSQGSAWSGNGIIS